MSLAQASLAAEVPGRDDDEVSQLQSLPED